MSRQHPVITVMVLLLVTMVSTAYLLDRKSPSTELPLTRSAGADRTTHESHADPVPLMELALPEAHDDRDLALEAVSPTHGESASARSPETSVHTDYEALYANYDLAELRGAVMEVAQRRGELAEPLIRAKFASGDYRVDSSVMNDEMYGIDVSPMRQGLQPVLSVRLEPIPGTEMKQPKVVQVDADEDPDLLLASMEHSWLLNRIAAMEQQEKETGGR